MTSEGDRYVVEQRSVCGQAIEPMVICRTNSAATAMAAGWARRDDWVTVTDTATGITLYDSSGTPRCECCGRILASSEGKVCTMCEFAIERQLAAARGEE